MELGAKIKRLRLKLGLTQEELADRCELTKGFISQLERDQASPSIATLMDILETLGTDLSQFFSSTRARKIVFTEGDTSVKEDGEGLKGSIRYLVPSAQTGRMEPILVEMAPGGETEEQDPHEGEEFGYVLSGQVTVVVGETRARARKNESFCYEPSAPHKLVNTGKASCKVIWVSSPPTF
ncbi:cupin domain-containing protein [Bacillota bacterium Meth-B3]|nr:cupin domain-containing protein [Christensenellaceae bacterium]MEA5064578.1 cupin domain-containing protein [Eubacteriales bacterium]MEA5069018.1 cupin domain-containing protein [Christensenellaceae bacterium]